MPAEKLMTVEEVSRVLSLTPRAVRKLVRDRRLACVALPGGRVRIEAAALSDFIEGCKNGGEPPG